MPVAAPLTAVGPDSQPPETERRARDEAEATENPEPLIVFFDGVCSLCHRTVRFIIENDPSKRFLFAPLQSDEARERLRPFSIDTSAVDALVLVDGPKCFEQSTAALRIAQHLRFPWPLLTLLLVIPAALRNFVYRWIARNRYGWFGREEFCQLPNPSESERFLGSIPQPPASSPPL